MVARSDEPDAAVACYHRAGRSRERDESLRLARTIQHEPDQPDRSCRRDRPTAAPPPTLIAENAPADVGKSWTPTKVWQGSDSRDTEELTMAGHWRVDWIFSPAKGGGSLHVFIYSVEPRALLYEAVGTQNGGADSSFWSGNGRFFLKINADRGDWKVAIQELR